MEFCSIFDIWHIFAGRFDIQNISDKFGRRFKLCERHLGISWKLFCQQIYFYSNSRSLVFCTLPWILISYFRNNKEVVFINYRVFFTGPPRKVLSMELVPPNRKMTKYRYTGPTQDTVVKNSFVWDQCT